jgi:hypothetical protein
MRGNGCFKVKAWWRFVPPVPALKAHERKARALLRAAMPIPFTEVRIGLG